MKKFLILCCFWIVSAALAEPALPVLTLEASQLNYVYPRPCTLRVTEEDAEASFQAAVKYRGMYSATFTGKRSYSVHLKTAAGEPLKASLLGLRRDDDYVLLGALSDPSRLRNAVGMELWRAYFGPAPSFAACELYFAQYYKGLYFLFERPDRKSAGVPREGALYRLLARRVEGVDALGGDAPDNPAGDTWYNLEKIYPAEDGGWQPLLDMKEHFPASLDLTAFADYYLFVNFIGASDNMSKNLFLCWDGARFYPMPWDLDAAFGRLYNADPADPGALYSGALFDALLADPAFQSLLASRWRTLRETLTPDTVTARFERWYERLEQSGVWEREAARFPAYTDAYSGRVFPLDPAGEIAALREYLSLRQALLDGTLR